MKFIHFKKIIFFLLILSLHISNLTSLKSQNCNFELDAFNLQHMNEVMANSNALSCVDNYSEFPYSQPITINLILGWYLEDPVNNTLDINDVIDEINRVYNPWNIYFNISVQPISCLECYNSEKIPTIINNDKCILGWIGTGLGDNGFFEKGYFISQISNVAHELGHCLGLFHTFASDVNGGAPENWPSEELKEYVTGELVNPGICDCNCLEAGDRICDTKTDPNIGLCNTSACTLWDNQFNSTLSTNFNPLGVTDWCGNVYFYDISFAKNTMSYHNNIGEQFITEGQAVMIRRRLNIGGGSYRFQSISNENPFLNLSNTPLEINIPTEYTGNNVKGSNIVVNSSLTLNNAILEFTGNNKIIVNPGAELKIINSKVRNFSDNNKCVINPGNFIGIELVGGNSSVDIEIKENSEIISSNGIYNTTGGSINLDIRNSKIEIINPVLHENGVELKNASGINFIYNSNFNSGTYFENCDFVPFLDCTFNKSSAGGTAISAINTSISVTGGNNINGFDKSILFNGPSKNIVLSWLFNFENAINSNNGGVAIDVVNANVVDIKDGNLNNYGLRILKANMTRIKNLTISLSSLAPYGIEVQDCRNFDILENNISGTGSQNGIRIGTTPFGLFESVSSNLIATNSLSNLSNGIINFDDYGDKVSGLSILCNEFNGTSIDINSQSDLAPTQGSPKNHAANLFFYNEMVNGDLFFNTGQVNNGISKYYYKDEAPQTPVNHNLGTLAIEADQGSTLSCDLPTPNPIVFPWAPTFVEPQPPFNDDERDYIPTCTWYWPPVIPQQIPNVILPQLPPYYPNLPDRVIYQLFENSEYITEEEMTDVLVNNPGVLNDDYIGWVVFSSNSFTPSNKQLILDAYNSNDLRLSGYARWNEYLKFRTAVMRHNVLGYVNNRTFTEQIFRNELSFRNDFQVVYEISESYWRENDFSSALNEINNSDITNIKDMAKVQEFQKYKDVLNIIVPLLNNDGTLNNLSTNDLNILTAIAEYNYGRATLKVREILNKYLNLSFDPIPFVNWYNPIFFKTEKRERKDPIEGVTLYPNPTNESIYIVIDEYTDNSEYEFSLFDSQGKLINIVNRLSKYNKIDISSISPGLFHYKISHYGKVVKSDNIIIAK